jgi:hypothetical protein
MRETTRLYERDNKSLSRPEHSPIYTYKALQTYLANQQWLEYLWFTLPPPFQRGGNDVPMRVDI